ncbi:PEP-CTERM sorting domain-containing protein [Pelagicoccus sp. SDUM812002]|uniref:PEP-CTERM sorting domain-containing protein n=1 Tax=Pelagicoccus sp. SDUM812002 TaxID=3041266 RepID=UPI00280CB60A|nr:PEP-CTERM sorting domain-containing protein [Pelagicoccus sp. SDUM812002]
MKLHKTLTAIAALASAALGFSATGDSLFFITFDFDSGTAPTVTDPAGAFASVSDFTGGAVSGGAMTANLTSGSPASFSFDFNLADNFVASIMGIGYGANYAGSIAAITGVDYGGLLLGGDVITGGQSKDVGILPSINGLTGSNTLTFEAVGFDGTVALEDFQVFGMISAVPEPSTVILGGMGGIMAFVMMRRRRQAAVQAA